MDALYIQSRTRDLLDSLHSDQWLGLDVGAAPGMPKSTRDFKHSAFMTLRDWFKRFQC